MLAVLPIVEFWQHLTVFSDVYDILQALLPGTLLPIADEEALHRQLLHSALVEHESTTAPIAEIAGS